MTTKALFTTVSMALCASILAGCGGTRENDPVEANTDNLALALQEAVDHSIIPAVNTFTAQTAAFKNAAVSFLQRSYGKQP